MSSSRPLVLVTMGDPAGVGPEVTLKAMASYRTRRLADFLIIGDAFVINNIGRLLGLRLKVPLLDLANVDPSSFSYGSQRGYFGRASIEYVDKALEILRNNKKGALVTAPVSKAAIRRSGVPDFQGHTEYLAHRTNSKRIAMMFVGKKLRVTLVTRHIPIKDVPRAVTFAAVYDTIMLTHKYLKKFFGIAKPRIGVSGLNPHAGEGGLFGNEEASVIIPAIRKASRRANSITGPIPPDAIFRQALNKKFDAIVSMYHDQGLGPFKTLYFNNGINLTLGLPFIRTSPDHGTAFDIAGRGVADPTSMIEAIRLACELVRRR